MRSIPALLQAHLDQPDTTTTRLIKISLTNGTVYGMTSLDRDVVYDDGEYSGEITYVATNGFNPETLQAEVGTSVDNTEAYALISDDIPGVTVEQAEAGDLDDAQWVCYLVNYEDLSMGHVTLDAGDLGEVRTRYGMIWIQEFLSYVSRLKQPIGHVWSTTCRAIFGSPANAQTGCGIDLTPLWVSGEVIGVGTENNRTFTGDAIESSGSVSPVPGRVQWLTGSNAGREFAVEEISSSFTVSLIETTGYPIQVGDTYRIRPDCRKRFAEDCIGIWNNGLNFKGEPLIPVGDSSQTQTPGAQLPGLGAFVNSSTSNPESPSPPSAPPAAGSLWPNWPMMNMGANQGSISNTLLDYATHSMIADKDVWMFQSFYPTISRLTSRKAALDNVLSLQTAPMNTKFLLYVIPSVAIKVTPGIPGQGEGEVSKELIDHATKGNDRWYIHKTGDSTLSGRVEDFFNPSTTWATNVGHALADLNSMGETYQRAYWKEWDTRLNQGGIDLRTYLAGFFMDNTSMRPLTYSQGNNTIDVTNNVDFNYNGVAENRNLWDGTANAGASQYSAGQFRFKTEMEAKFSNRFLLPNTSGWTSDYTDGVAPPLPISNHPCYRKWEIVMMEVTNNRLGLHRDLSTATGYKYNGGGSAATLYKELQLTDRMLKLDANAPSFMGKCAIMAQSTMNDRTFTQDDIEFARTMSLVCLLEERAGPCVQHPSRVFSLDETLVALGAPQGTRSMGTLNESTYSFSMRSADQTVGAAKFYWAIFADAIIVWRGDNPSVAVWPNPADAAVTCTLPSAGAGRKWQRLNAATYVNPITGRATRNQSPSINDGSDVTTVSLKPFQAILLRRVPV